MVLSVELNGNVEGHEDMTYFCEGQFHDLLNSYYQ